MKSRVRLIRKKRRYSESFKKQLVKEFESGQYSVPQLQKLYGVSNSTIYSWIYQFSTFNERGNRVVEMKDSSTDKIKKLEQQVKELQSIVGSKQIQIEYLEKMMEIAKEELNIDIKKNFNTPPSSGSESTKKK